MTDRPTFAPPSGPVVGWADPGRRVVRATGIPYATAERFAPPVPALDRTEPFEATGWAPACPQAPVPFLERVLGSEFAELPTDERCQNLSVTMPADLRPGERLPVMVWIHGGSYTSGAGDVPVMDPAPLVAEQRVVVVTVTYRLGLFGYLGGTVERPANLGLLDQVEAFRWVQRNIEAFGGDPRRVTAFGQSAGGDAVAHLMATPGASSLFSRAILQSAPLGIARGRRAMNAAMLEVAMRDVAMREVAMPGGATLDRAMPDRATHDAADGVAAVPPSVVVAQQWRVAAAAKGSGLRAAMPFGTQYGFAPLPAEADVDAAWDAVAGEVEVLVGHTSEEARLFVPGLPTVRRAVEIPVVGSVVRRVLVRAVTEAVYGRPARRFARRHARAGGRAHRYVISWSAPGNPWGAAHTVDLPLLFGDEQTWERAELVDGASWGQIQSAGRAVRAVWGAFARGEDLGVRGGADGVLSYRMVP